MWAIVGRIFYCPLLNSKSPLICIIGNQQKDHKPRSLNYFFFANQRALFFANALPALQRLCAYGPFEDCQVWMFVKQRALPSANVCEAGLIAKCECLWSSRTGSSSSYLLLKIKLRSFAHMPLRISDRNNTMSRRALHSYHSWGLPVMTAWLVIVAPESMDLVRENIERSWLLVRLRLEHALHRNTL